MKILLLEDDDPLRLVWKEAISAMNHDVTDVNSTNGAMAHLMTTRFDLAILDLMVGEANSLSLTHYIAYAVPGMRVMVVTGSGLFPRGGVNEIAPGVDWLMRKPLSINDLTAMIDYAATLCAVPKSQAPPQVPDWVEHRGQ